MVKSTVTMSLLNFGQASIIAIGVTLIMVFAADGVVSDEMTIGDLVLVNALMLQLFVPMNMLGIVYRQITYALADMDLLTKLLNETPEVKDKDGAHCLQVEQWAVEFKHVAFSYNPDRVILRDISMRIAPGQKIAVVGPSGAGKSTIARLLFRFYEPTGGRVLIDGQNIAESTQDSLSQQIGMVPQETVLFNNSIHFNIEYARPGATEAEIQAAIRVAQLDQLIAQLPEGMDTIVGERGLKLSGCELQRVAIARAILKKPKILIFDEATSSLDSDTEVALMQSIREAASGVTSLIIAHRLSTIIDADCIYVLEAGRVVEQGSHAQLLAMAGLYSRLWNLQQSKQEQKEG